MRDKSRKTGQRAAVQQQGKKTRNDVNEKINAEQTCTFSTEMNNDKGKNLRTQDRRTPRHN